MWRMLQLCGGQTAEANSFGRKLEAQKEMHVRARVVHS